MPSPQKDTPVETFPPLTLEPWPDLETLFEHHGYPGSCWCMWRRLRSSDYERLTGKERKQALQSLLKAGTQLGVVGYMDQEPAGWCSIAPRETFPRMERSIILPRIDAQPVWSVTCFFWCRACAWAGFYQLAVRRRG